MAQTKKKRRTKHRGNAAGIVESRGRTGRPLTKEEKGSKGSRGRPNPRDPRFNRLDEPPSWRSSANRAAIATAVFLGAILLIFKQPLRAAIPLAAFMFLIYIPMGYYTDVALYRRRQRKKAASKD